jgi:hypothetical protein
MRALSLIRLCVLLSCAGAACSQERHSESGAISPADYVYPLRGQIVKIETVGPDTIATVAHEAIPSFKDRDGRAGTMPAMTMPFVLSSHIDRSQLTPKSQWQLTLEVRWSQAPGMLITEAKPLAAGTTLTLESAH